MTAVFTKKNIRTIIIVALCFVVLACVAGGVWAYLNSKTETVSNEFVPAKVSCSIEETFNGEVKSDVKIKNTGNVDAYIRAMVIVNFKSSDGKILATSPKEGVDYNITWASRGWAKGSDGFWYYSESVAPEALTANLIETASAISAPKGYSLDIQIIASAIQSDPDRAVIEAWGITPSNGMIYPN